MVQKERFKNNYDLLRVLSSLFVMFFHSFGLLHKVGTEPLFSISNGKLNTGFIGLTIFFSISGYLIAKSALRSPGVVNYLWKRFLRIQPLLFIVCLLSVFLVGPFFTELTLHNYFFNINTWTYFRNIMPAFGLQFTLPGVFQHNIEESGINGSLWTLIVEERLYIFTSVLFLIRNKRRPAAPFVIFTILLNLIYIIDTLFSHSHLFPYMHEEAFFYALIFLNAALCFLFKINFNAIKVPATIIGILLFALALNFKNLTFLYTWSIPVIVNSIAQFKGITNRVGKWGDFTYGTYVFAFPVQQMLIAEMGMLNPYILFLWTFLLVVPLAVASWHLVEKRFLKLKSSIY